MLGGLFLQDLLVIIPYSLSSFHCLLGSLSLCLLSVSLLFVHASQPFIMFVTSGDPFSQSDP